MTLKIFLFCGILIGATLMLTKIQCPATGAIDMTVNEHANGTPLNKTVSTGKSERPEISAMVAAAIKPEIIILRDGRTSIDYDRNLTKLDTPGKITAEHAYAKRHGAVGKITVRVIDSEGNPVQFADLKGGFYIGDEKGVPFSTNTDTHGFASIEDHLRRNEGGSK